MNQDLVDELGYSWLEVHKKSAVSFLVLAALDGDQMWSKNLGEWMTEVTGWEISEKSLYRTLRRMQKQGTIEYETRAAERTGASRKVFILTAEGRALLRRMQKELGYIERASG